MRISQKSFNWFSASLHLKVNELVASHESANNSMISKLSKEYVELAKRIKKDEETTGKTIDSIRTEKQK